VSLPTRGLSGRDRELIEADEALATSASGTPQALLVGGDAGIGKTTLVAEIARRAAVEDFRVLTGHCLDVDAGMPLAPVLEALRSHVDGRLVDTLAPVTRRLAPYLLAQTSGSPPPVDLMSDLHASLVELAREAPVLLVLEDMHWADRTTQDFAASLARTMQGRFLLALTFRSDDLTRRHPFRRALVDIGRSVGSRRLDLEPLDREGIASIVLAATGSADPTLVGSLLARSEGNPLYAEELLGADPDGVPGALGDLLLARVDALSEGTVELLRLASVNGARIDSALLAEVCGSDEAEVDSALREALDANVLARSDHEVGFRHGLLREAVYDDLLPGERTRIHARFAAALQDRLGAPSSPESVHQLARLAFHWDAAKDQPRAFVAAVDAGLALRRVGLNEAMTYLERAVDLWDRVPDAEELCGVAKADLLRHLAVGAKVADGDEIRSVRFMREALSLVSEDVDPLLASRVYSTYGELCHELDDAIGQRDAVSRALAHAEGTPSAELAGALLAMGHCEWRRQQVSAALAYFDRSRDVARQAGLVDHEADALSTSGFAAFELGQCAAGIQRLKDAERIAEAAGLLGLALYAHSDLAYMLLAMGDVEQAHELAVEGRARARSLGLPDPAALNGEQLSMLYRFAGRLDDADLILEELREQLMRPHRWRIERAENLLARGELQPALTLEQETMALIEETAGIGDADHLLRQVRLLCGLGEVDEALELVGRYLEEVAGTDSPITRSCAAAAAWTA
jgi:tetratricopeptide (TPR) repeat protein